MYNPGLLPHIIFWGKVAGAVATFGGFVWAAFSWFHTINDTNKNVTLLTTNHLPHIQLALDAHGAALQGIKSDVRDVDTKVSAMHCRLDDNVKATASLGEAFTRHLESSSTEVVIRKRTKR